MYDSEYEDYYEEYLYHQEIDNYIDNLYWLFETGQIHAGELRYHLSELEAYY